MAALDLSRMASSFVFGLLIFVHRPHEELITDICGAASGVAPWVTKHFKFIIFSLRYSLPSVIFICLSFVILGVFWGMLLVWHGNLVCDLFCWVKCCLFRWFRIGFSHFCHWWLHGVLRHHYRGLMGIRARDHEVMWLRVEWETIKKVREIAGGFPVLCFA